MAQTHALRLTHRAPSARAASHGEDEIAREHRSSRARAGLALVTAWAALAVAIAVHAIDHESIGAAALAVFVASLLAAPWRAVVAGEEPRRQIAFA